MKKHNYVSFKFERIIGENKVSYARLPISAINASGPAQQLYGKRLADAAANIGIPITGLPSAETFLIWTVRGNATKTRKTIYRDREYIVSVAYVG